MLSVKKLLAKLLLVVAPALLLGCKSTPSYNPTTFPYQMDEARLERQKIRTVVIPHVNLGGPSRNYLEKEAPRIDTYITAYLEENGIEVIPQRTFQQHWNTAVRAYGTPIDPTTGKLNDRTYSTIMSAVRDEMMKSTPVDAFVFTQLLEFEVPFNSGFKHLARWDGVTRQPALRGSGSAVPADFDWNTPAAVASLKISIFDTDLQRLFVGRGGMDATDAVNTRSSSGGYIRRRSILEYREFVMEGIQLAFHPFIEYPDWPGRR